MATQTIMVYRNLVYRNPIEQQFYESGNVFPLLCSIFVMGIVIFTLVKFIDSFLGRKLDRKHIEFLNYLSFVVGVLSMFLTYNYMAI